MGPTRRDVLGALTAMSLLGCKETLMSATMPVLFLAHGAPPLLDDPGWVGELAVWGKALPRPQAIVVVSAHWEERPLSIGATTPVPLIYDFYGFPDKFYRLQYPSPGAPEVAQRIRGLLASPKIACIDAPARGLDHGTYLPLMCMYPEADIPVLQISLPSQTPSELFAVGRALAPLRREGVLVIGSGFLTHNLRALSLRETPAWARDFDAWSADVIARRDIDALLDYRTQAPGVREALPTHEHFVPVIVAAGAAGESAVRFPITGFWWGGAMTRRSVQFG
ncbi:MAG TPA: class III extradiol ring-cleavage dioxygenase [Kofleriaceae bacterium]|jgi:4,5-DOPA dioxygenase extradiol|nr:class III extradiol ring-cleavage dioxygenase [Kofleriaceae bacterium]